MARRKHHKFRRRHNPIGSLTAPFGAFTAGYSMETLKLAGSVLGGGIVTMLGSNLLIDNVVRKIVPATGLMGKIVDFLATGLVAGAVATGSRYVVPFRSNEVLAGGMLAAASRLFPQIQAPQLKGWSDDLDMGPIPLGDFADPQRAAMPMMYGMGDFVAAGPQAPINRPMLAGMGDAAAFNQVQNPVSLTGMEGLVAEAIDEL